MIACEVRLYSASDTALQIVSATDLHIQHMSDVDIILGEKDPGFETAKILISSSKSPPREMLI
jgi:hypothetical protein